MSNTIAPPQREEYLLGNTAGYQSYVPAYMSAPPSVVVHDFNVSWSRMFALQFKFWVVATILSALAGLAAIVLWFTLIVTLFAVS